MATADILSPASRAMPQIKFNYYNGKEDPLEALDFRKPGTEQKFEHYQGMIETVTTSVRNVRQEQDQYSLDQHGFQFAKDPVIGLQNATTDDEIRNVLLPATENLVKQLTGAYKVIVFTHRIRNQTEDENKRADNKAPAHRVHTDFTPAGALNHLKNVVCDPVERTALKTDRIMVINVWRPLKVIKRDPLAILDWQTIQTEDIVPNRMIMNDNFWSELGMVKSSPRHQWVFLEDQTPEEPVVFKQYDSGNKNGLTVPHSAFVDPRWTDEEARQSIEIKMFAFVR